MDTTFQRKEPEGLETENSRVAAYSSPLFSHRFTEVRHKFRPADTLLFSVSNPSGSFR